MSGREPQGHGQPRSRRASSTRADPAQHQRAVDAEEPVGGHNATAFAEVVPTVVAHTYRRFGGMGFAALVCGERLAATLPKQSHLLALPGVRLD